MHNWKKIMGGVLVAGMFVLSGCGGGGEGNTTVTGPVLTIIPSGDSSYIVQGTRMDGVAGIDLTISYDAVLHQGTPTVNQESLVSGALPAVNVSLPGTIRIAIISTSAFSGSGPIATITFASKSATAPLPSITYSLIDSKGSPVASSAL